MRFAHWLRVLFLALLLAAPAAAHEGDDQGGIEMLLQDSSASEGATETPTMSFGEWGVDTSLLSDEIDPGDDFFAYVNQEWLDANPLPPEYSRFGAFNLLREKSTSDVKTLVDSLLAKPEAQLTGDEKRIVDAYNAYFDTSAIDAAGLSHAQPYLDKVRNADTLAELATLWGALFGLCRLGRPRPSRPRLLSGREREGAGDPVQVPRLSHVPDG